MYGTGFQHVICSFILDMDMKCCVVFIDMKKCIMSVDNQYTLQIKAHKIKMVLYCVLELF